jgi:hypothetical protein
LPALRSVAIRYSFWSLRERTMPTDKQFVLAAYPQAEAALCKGIKLADLPHDKEDHYAIYAAHGLGAERLGRGSTEDEAWKDASRGIRGKLN